MSGKRYSEEFKIEAVKQITERNYPIGQVSKRPGVTTKSLYAWIKRYSDGPSQHSQITDQQREIRDLKAQLKRTEEERTLGLISDHGWQVAVFMAIEKYIMIYGN